MSPSPTGDPDTAITTTGPGPTDAPEAAPEVRAEQPAETPWRRLDPRMLVVGPLGGLVRLIPVVAILLITGGGDVWRVWIAIGAAVAVVLAGVLRWRTTRYRITAERVELHSGWLNRQRRSVPLDRIRTVDLTARLLHRLFGLGVVQISAAAAATPGAGGGLQLDAVSRTEAEQLRRELLDRSAAGRAGAPSAATAPTGAAPATAVPPAAAPPGTVLARLHWSWLRYAPLTLSALAGIGAVLATVWNLLGDLGVDPRDIPVVDEAGHRLAAAPLWVALGVLGGTLLMLAVVGALVLFAERWYGYRLTREPDGTLQVRRGLLTRRALSVAESRLRGAEVVEPLLLRAGGGAQARAVSTGLGGAAQGGALIPPAPRALVHEVAAAALRTDVRATTLAPLYRHPRAALVRRLTRAVVPVAGLAAVGFALDGTLLDGTLLPGWVGPLGLVLLPLAVLLGWDRYRNLGHRLTGGYLVSRHGSLVRRTVAVQRDGVIGWTIRQTPFQRRAGLVTLQAVTAAGAGGYELVDLAADDAVALATATAPGLLTPLRAAPSTPASGGDRTHRAVTDPA